MLTKFLPFLFFLLFPFLLLGSLPSATFRYILIALLGVSAVIYSLRSYDLSKLGLLEGFKTSHLIHILFSALIVCAIFILKPWLADLHFGSGGFRFLGEGSWRSFLPAYYMLVSVPFQELVYRSFLVNFLEEFRMGEKQVLLVGAALFALLHIAWGKYLVFGAFWLGLYWVWLFMRTRSVWLLFLSHLVVGSTAVFLLYICC